MNTAKFILTVLVTSIYTSSWWWLATASKEMCNNYLPVSIISLLVVLVGTVIGFVSFVAWLADNWDNE
jgi:hypothetical protein